MSKVGLLASTSGAALLLSTVFIAGAATAKSTTDQPATAQPTTAQPATAQPTTAPPTTTTPGQTTVPEAPVPGAPVPVADPAAQDAAAPAEGGEIVVTGIRASLQSAANIKRNASSIVDAISAEDMGAFSPNIRSANWKRCRVALLPIR